MSNVFSDETIAKYFILMKTQTKEEIEDEIRKRFRTLSASNNP